MTITALATDVDSDVLVDTSFAADSAQYLVTITNDSSVWTFTPKSADSIGESVAAGNLEDSSGEFTYTFRWNDGVNVVSKQVTISYTLHHLQELIGVVLEQLHTLVMLQVHQMIL